MIKQTEKAELRKNGGRRNIASENGERKPTSKVKDLFRKFAHKTSEIVGSPWSFIIAVATLIIWAAMDPSSGFF